MEARFLNIDLVLESAEPLQLIEQQMGSSVYVLYSGRTDDGYLLTFEIEGDASDPDQTINTLCQCVENLPEESKALWSRCRCRLFDVGFNASDDPHLALHAILRHETLNRIVQLGGEIAFTVYQPTEDETP